MFETSPSPKSKNSDDNAEICDSDDDIIFPPSPDVDLSARSVQRSQVKRRRVSWDKTVDIEARLADSPGFRAKFATPENKRHKSQIEAVSPATPAPLVDLGSVKVSTSSHLSMLCLELFVQTRQQLRPDPEYDPILGCFYRLMSADDDWDPVTGCIIVGPPGTVEPSEVVRQTFVTSELMLVKSVVRLVRDTDPDILAGYEVQMASWGFLSARAAVLDINLCPLLFRVPASVRESKIAD